eukprot:scaffold1958_cov253-Pinguiococcus_pyrenoidosus.AAC.2
MKTWTSSLGPDRRRLMPSVLRRTVPRRCGGAADKSAARRALSSSESKPTKRYALQCCTAASMRAIKRDWRSCGAREATKLATFQLRIASIETDKLYIYFNNKVFIVDTNCRSLISTSYAWWACDDDLVVPRHLLEKPQRQERHPRPSLLFRLTFVGPSTFWFRCCGGGLDRQYGALCSGVCGGRRRGAPRLSHLGAEHGGRAHGD